MTRKSHQTHTHTHTKEERMKDPPQGHKTKRDKKPYRKERGRTNKPLGLFGKGYTSKLDKVAQHRRENPNGVVRTEKSEAKRFKRGGNYRNFGEDKVVSVCGV